MAFQKHKLDVCRSLTLLNSVTLQVPILCITELRADFQQASNNAALQPKTTENNLTSAVSMVR